jgi:predicted nucleic acid-binding protein
MMFLRITLPTQESGTCKASSTSGYSKRGRVDENVVVLKVGGPKPPQVDGAGGRQCHSQLPEALLWPARLNLVLIALRDRRVNGVRYNHIEEMEQMAKPEELQHGERPESKRRLVFLDTNVIIGYLRGDRPAAKLFSAEAAGRIRFAVNAIVLQELLLAADAAGRPEFERIRDHLRVLPVDFARAEALLPRVRALRNRLAHSNDLLILSSAGQCDFLVTSDADFKSLVTEEKPRVVTP